MKAAVLTVSDGVDMGTREDASGDLLEELLVAEGFEVVRRVVPDERDPIAEAIEELADEARLVLTTGGTGIGPRDVTPEATASVLERMVPGIAEAMRADSIDKTPHALLSRGIAGVRGTTLVVNLPGSTGGLSRRVRDPAAGAPARAGAARGRGDRAQADVRPGRFISLVKFEHTIFALPFAYVGAFLAVDGVPSAHDLLWITVAMIGARSLAMGLNRLIDASIDARNPRTASRELPSGQLTEPQVALFCLVSLGVFLLAVWQLDPIVRWLWPIPVAGVRDLPVPEAVHVDLAPLARRRGRPGADGRVDCDHRRSAARGLAARGRGRVLGGRIRLLLRAARRRLRPARGPEVGGDRGSANAARSGRLACCTSRPSAC